MARVIGISQVASLNEDAVPKTAQVVVMPSGRRAQVQAHVREVTGRDMWNRFRSQSSRRRDIVYQGMSDRPMMSSLRLIR